MPKNNSGGNKSGGSRSGGNKSNGGRSGGNRSNGNRSGGNRSNGNRSGGMMSTQSILSKIGVGTPNIRIHTEDATFTGVYLGISNGSAIINEGGAPRYIKLSAITAVDVGV
ncbi:hypothetical protein AB4Z29_19750 [Paenibacillus sp. 2TAB23]|uniref:hypothetical protein n=1 Tax=Paenibacillus sp. 2TAB23 TaxID=3233004 RepID=UPI003F9B8027